MEFNAIYSSPLRRALETAQIIADYHKLVVQVESDLRELEVGEMEGMTLKELNTDFSQFLLQWRNGEGRVKLPGGESLADLQNRVWSTIQRITHGQNGTIVVVSHYFVTLTVICAALGLPLSYLRRFRIQVGSISILDFTDSRPCLISLGDTCHLKEV